MTPMTLEELGVFHAMKPGRWYLDSEIAARHSLIVSAAEVRPILGSLAERGAIVAERIKWLSVTTYSRPDR